MRLYVDIWAEDLLSKDDFWEVVDEASKAVAAVTGDGWSVREVGLQTNRKFAPNTGETK